MSVATWLEHSGANRDIVAWAEPFGRDWRRAITECPRADWLLAIGAKLGVPREALARAAMACVRVANAGGTIGPVAQAALDSVHSWAIHWEPFADCARHIPRCEAAAAEASTPAEAALLNAVAAIARTPNEPGAAAVAASHAIELCLAHASDDELMSTMLTAQKACVEAARVHLPWELFEIARAV